MIQELFSDLLVALTAKLPLHVVAKAILAVILELETSNQCVLLCGGILWNCEFSWPIPPAEEKNGNDISDYLLSIKYLYIFLIEKEIIIQHGQLISQTQDISYFRVQNDIVYNQSSELYQYLPQAAQVLLANVLSSKLFLYLRVLPWSVHPYDLVHDRQVEWQPIH